MTERHVGVPEMMAAREARARRQQEMRQNSGLPLVSLTMNIAGPVKTDARIVEGFALAERRIADQFARHSLAVAERFSERLSTGPEALWAVDAEPVFLKRLMVAIEEDGPFGRLLDIDVLGIDGEKLSREKPRRCLLCEKEAMLCARSREHSAEALFAEAQRVLAETLDGLYADAAAAAAQRALLREVAVTPKPGLVDRANSGAHRDMDFFSFLDSASVLGGYFRECVGIAMRAESPEAAFAALRYPGMRAETVMRTATGGANTHQGAIFSLGLLCGALGILRKRGEAVNAEHACAAVREMAAEALREEMRHLDCAGARGEAARGFPAARDVGLPALREKAALGANDAGVHALLRIMAHLEDTNVLRRGGAQAAKRLRETAQKLCADASLEAVEAFDRALIAENLSPGGAADILAVSFFLDDIDAGIVLR